ncbi:MAG: hypothetical protein MN733_22825 [Nitrososphaera sp.]|nr:hypothetical protein [Nitrososphaera sp.]
MKAHDIWCPVILSKINTPPDMELPVFVSPQELDIIKCHLGIDRVCCNVRGIPAIPWSELNG